MSSSGDESAHSGFGRRRGGNYSDSMEPGELLDRYEDTGDPAFLEEAQPLFEDALAANPDDAWLRLRYGYLLECRARILLRDALAQYGRAAELDPASRK